MKNIFKVVLPLIVVICLLCCFTLSAFAAGTNTYTALPSINYYVDGYSAYFDANGNVSYYKSATLGDSINKTDLAEYIITQKLPNQSASVAGMDAVYIWYHGASGSLNFVRIPTYIGMSQTQFFYKYVVDTNHNMVITSDPVAGGRSVNFVVGTIRPATHSVDNISNWTCSTFNVTDVNSFSLNIQNIIYNSSFRIFNIDRSVIFDHFLPSLQLDIPYSNILSVRGGLHETNVYYNNGFYYTDVSMRFMFATSGNNLNPYRGLYHLDDKQIDYILSTLRFNSEYTGQSGFATFVEPESILKYGNRNNEISLRVRFDIDFLTPANVSRAFTVTLFGQNISGRLYLAEYEEKTNYILGFDELEPTLTGSVNGFTNFLYRFFYILPPWLTAAILLPFSVIMFAGVWTIIKRVVF